MYNQTMNYKLSLIPSGILYVNTWILFHDDFLYLIDPGGNPDKIISHIEKERENYFKNSYNQPKIIILLTHCHFDHIAAVPDLMNFFPQARLYAHKTDGKILGEGSREKIIQQTLWCGIDGFGNILTQDLPPALALSEGDKVGDFRVLHTPGHTPGSCCYYWEEENLLFSGDTLFSGSYGRTDFPGGSSEEMANSLKKLSTLPKETLVLPGHGETSTIGAESHTFTLLS